MMSSMDSPKVADKNLLLASFGMDSLSAGKVGSAGRAGCSTVGVQRELASCPAMPDSTETTRDMLWMAHSSASVRFGCWN